MRKSVDVVMDSTRTLRQVQRLGPRTYEERGERYRITAVVRFDDQCKNGHNSFSLTAEIEHGSRNNHWRLESGGCLHDEIRRHFPELTHLLRWHLCFTDGPLHYIANARYWAGHSGYTDGKPNDPPNREHLNKTIAFGAVPQWDDGRRPENMDDTELQMWLKARLPDLIARFRNDMEGFGFTW